MFTRDCPGRDSSQYNEYMSQLAYVIKTIDVSDYLTTDSDQQWNYVILVIVMLLKMSWVQTKPHFKKTQVVGSIPTVVRHIFQACPVWIYTQSDITSIIFTWVQYTNTEKSWKHICIYLAWVLKHYTVLIRVMSWRTVLRLLGITTKQFQKIWKTYQGTLCFSKFCLCSCLELIKNYLHFTGPSAAVMITN
jgi:hypothetical protein